MTSRRIQIIIKLLVIIKYWSYLPCIQWPIEFNSYVHHTLSQANLFTSYMLYIYIRDAYNISMRNDSSFVHRQYKKYPLHKIIW